MSIFSVGRLMVGCTLLDIIADARVSTPSLPENISSVMMNFDPACKRGVMPVVRPTVAMAETHSKDTSRRVISGGSMAQMMSVAVSTKMR